MKVRTPVTLASAAVTAVTAAGIFAIATSPSGAVYAERIAAQEVGAVLVNAEGTTLYPKQSGRRFGLLATVAQATPEGRVNEAGAFTGNLPSLTKADACALDHLIRSYYDPEWQKLEGNAAAYVKIPAPHITSITRACEADTKSAADNLRGEFATVVIKIQAADSESGQLAMTTELQRAITGKSASTGLRHTW